MRPSFGLGCSRGQRQTVCPASKSSKDVKPACDADNSGRRGQAFEALSDGHLASGGTFAAARHSIRGQRGHFRAASGGSRCYGRLRGSVRLVAAARARSLSLRAMT